MRSGQPTREVFSVPLVLSGAMSCARGKIKVEIAAFQIQLHHGLVSAVLDFEKHNNQRLHKTQRSDQVCVLWQCKTLWREEMTSSGTDFLGGLPKPTKRPNAACAAVHNAGSTQQNE